jgi:hypothetical protein
MKPSDSIAWIRSAPFDLLVIANVLWPLLLLPGFSSSEDTAVDFWQLYYLTLPHRWITLALVAADPDRRASVQWQLLFSTLGLGAIVLAVGLSADALLCLGAIDYAWNGWHFASQHAGVLRIYAKKTNSGNPWLERWGMRLFIVYVILRTAGLTLWGGLPMKGIAFFAQWLDTVDFGMLVIPAALWITNLKDWKRDRTAKWIYLSSVLLLYTGYMLAFHTQTPRWILCFATAASLFHAVEYLAIVSHYARRRETQGTPGAMQWIGRNWFGLLVLFLLAMGTLGWWLSNADTSTSYAWQALNLWVAFTHYAWDGLIWKLRRSDTSQALGAT